MNPANEMAATKKVGRFTVYLGMAAGVGKTFRMLRDAQLEAERGVDVVIAYLEPHDRPETIFESAALEMIPRRLVEYRGTSVEEMNPAAVIARAPELALVDELAHTNAAGAEHEKRFEDVRDLLAAGIDVWSTMNVQHLESLNDQVNELTGTKVRETVPDGVLSEADEVLLIDLPPEALIERLRAGKIYAAERVESALNNFFRIENLGALRTLALRQVADDVEAKRLTVTTATRRTDRIGQRAVPQAVSERAMALVTPHPSSQRIIRRAWRSAQRLACPLDVVWVEPHDDQPGADQKHQLAAISQLTSVLGANLIVTPGDDIARTVRELARERGTTYLMLGPPKPRSAIERSLRPSLLDRLLEALPGVDVRVIADRSKLPEREDQ